MFSKVFVVCALACVAAAYEDVDIQTFDTIKKLEMLKPYLTKEDIMTKDVMDIPFYRQFWWKKFDTPILMDDYKQDLPREMVRLDLPYTRDMIMTPYNNPYDLKMRYINRPILLNKILSDYDLLKKERMMMMMPYYQRMMMQNYMMY